MNWGRTSENEPDKTVVNLAVKNIGKMNWGRTLGKLFGKTSENQPRKNTGK